MIISVGYRVNSKKGTQFRIWANNILKQYLIEGYALNEEKLKAQQEKLNDLNERLRCLPVVSDRKTLGITITGILAILKNTATL